ncbi:hypothetical protein [Shewanella ulleungensis]|uniref:GRAM domain-containing protein n=1 Tax=Shewanella ulleungensis TaxID=2282699 RepID=A0ABQ2QQM0_9GAMM|nr:hypothetical protein [Shewanella ulleungensis]MCL1150348.1 hypothetical protein [Shewanella ulleungensis]GGP88201.1 hypothetical protein GCM10009410_22480 [Shewanella ulleungensis]
MENLIKSVTATLQAGVAKSDGKLTLTTSHINFEPYNKQLGLGPYTFELSHIIKVKKSMAKGAGILPLSTDAIELTFTDNQIKTFILANADEWMRLLTPAG